MRLEDLKPPIHKLPPDEGLALIEKIRQSRMTPKVSAKRSVQRKKELTKSKRDLLESIPADQLLKMLQEAKK